MQTFAPKLNILSRFMAQGFTIKSFAKTNYPKLFLRIFCAAILVFSFSGCTSKVVELEAQRSLPNQQQNIQSNQYYQQQQYQQPYQQPYQPQYQQPYNPYANQYQQQPYNPYYYGQGGGSRYYSNPYALPAGAQYAPYDSDQYYVAPSYYQNVEQQPSRGGSSPF